MHLNLIKKTPDAFRKSSMLSFLKTVALSPGSFPSIQSLAIFSLPTPGCAEFSHPGTYLFIYTFFFFANSLGAFQEQMFLCDDCQQSLAFHTSSPCTTQTPCVVLNYSWILFNNKGNFTLPPSHSLLNKTTLTWMPVKFTHLFHTLKGDWKEKENTSALAFSPPLLLASMW